LTGTPSFHIRMMRESDLDQIIKIENASFTDPWPRSALSEGFGNRLAHQYVMEIPDKDKIAAYCQCWVVLDEGHILNIAVAPEFRGQGLGRKMMDFIIRAMIAKDVRYIFLEVKISNIIAQNLYNSMGFRQIDMRRKYYSDGSDALIMMKEVL